MNKHDYIFFAGLAIWFAETWYFGFNEHPVNGIERTLDNLSIILMLFGCIGSILKQFAPVTNVYNYTLTSEQYEGIVRHVQSVTLK